VTFEPERQRPAVDQRPGNDVLISPGSYREIAIKVSLRKLDLR
jgi:hypothetical protein